MDVKKRSDYIFIPIVLRTAVLRLVLLVLAVALVSCSSHTSAPISSLPQPPSDKINSHIVSTGETLYSISWRYGLDHRKMAAANNINAPYTIFVGQRLSLDLSALPKQGTVAKSKTVTVKSEPSKTPVTAASRPARQRGSMPKKTVEPKPKSTHALPKRWKWRWPLVGRVVRSYDASKRFKGVYIHAPKGTPVKAAAPGVVVYAGNGLHSYGRAIIIKHSEVYLSFYALNSRLLVKEGDRVSVGGTIAEVGGDVNNPNRIYFEIRHNGNSTDPLRLLPKQ